ncbi:DUF1295 domain-containing protein [Candidatus Woesearchaeota archaeon]|nr:DUF1295 domain-containing protein [Candidatus Woesearchaeota archaeon]
MLLQTFLFAVGFNILMFLPAYFFQTDKLTDLSYSLTFVAIALYLFIAEPFSTGRLLLVLMVFLWAARLGGFLFIRIRKQKKDDRFDSMRGSFFRFLGFWLLQGVTVWVVLLPVTLFEGPFHPIGVGVWLLGLLIESVADQQKYAFKQDPKNKGLFIRSGLWSYSRHPNYFGEILCWVGVYLAAGVWVYGLLSPLYITCLLLFVSGIPLLERKADEKWGRLEAYQDYKRSTSLLVPWRKKR